MSRTEGNVFILLVMFDQNVTIEKFTSNKILGNKQVPFKMLESAVKQQPYTSQSGLLGV